MYPGSLSSVSSAPLSTARLSDMSIVAAPFSLGSLPMCALAKRVKKPITNKGMANSLENNEAKSRYKLQVNVINGLDAHQDTLVAVESFLTDAIAAKLKKSQASDHDFSSVTTFGAHDGPWTKVWVSTRTKISVGVLDLALAINPHVVSNLFLHMLNCSSGLKVPSSCLSAVYFTYVCDVMWVHFGRRLHSASTDGLINQQGRVDYSKLSYSVDSVDVQTNRVLTVIHRPSRTVAEIDSDIHIIWGEKWQLMSTFSDNNAYITNGRTIKYAFKEMFAEDKGPHLLPEITGNCKQFKSFLSQATDSMSSKANPAVAATGLELTSPQKLPRCLVVEAKKLQIHGNALEKARQALRKRKVDRAESGACTSGTDKTVRKVKANQAASSNQVVASGAK